MCELENLFKSRHQSLLPRGRSRAYALISVYGAHQYIKPHVNINMGFSYLISFRTKINITFNNKIRVHCSVNMV